MKQKIIRITTVPISMKVLLKGQNSFLTENNFEVYTISGIGKETTDLVSMPEIKGHHEVISLKRQISPFNDVIAIFTCYKIIKKIKPVIVHTYTPKAGLVGMIASFLARTPIKIHNVTGLPLVEETGFKKLLLVWVEKLIYTFADQVYVNSFELLDFIKKNIYRNKYKLKILGNGSTNGINTEFYKKTNEILDESTQVKDQFDLKNNFTWIFIGRIVKDKGINELVQAFDLFSQEFPSKLLIVGDFEEDLDPVAKSTKKILDQNKSIVLSGFKQDVRPFLAAADCLVFPSYREGLPNVPMQAACFNLPIIATDINGCNEIVQEGVNGLLVPPKNTDALLATMKKIYLDKELREKMADTTRDIIIQKYDQKEVWNNLLMEYNNLLKNVPQN